MIQQLIAELAGWLPFGFAFGAGMVATVNPCGFLLLPSYVAFYMGTAEGGQPPHGAIAIVRALTLALSVTLGFGIIFSALGLVLSLAGRALLGIFPVIGIAVGTVLAGLGLWLLLSRRSLGIAAASRVTAKFRRNAGGAFVFGISYGLASLSCTLPVFLAVVGSALAAQGLARALLQFVVFSLGMGAVVAVVVIGAAILKGALRQRWQSLMPYVHETAAIFLVAAGAYLIYYWLRYGALF